MKDTGGTKKAKYSAKSKGSTSNGSKTPLGPSSAVGFANMSGKKDKTKRAKGYKTSYGPPPGKQDGYGVLEEVDEYEEFLTRPKDRLVSDFMLIDSDSDNGYDSEPEVLVQAKKEKAREWEEERERRSKNHKERKPERKSERKSERSGGKSSSPNPIQPLPETKHASPKMEQAETSRASVESANDMINQTDFISFDVSSDDEPAVADTHYSSDGYLSNDESSFHPNASRPNVNSSFPWVKDHDHSAEQEISDWLTMEIRDFIAYISPHAEEIKARNDAVRRLREAITGLWPDCEVQVFGSYATDLYLPGSDIDMVITSASGCQFDNRLSLYQLSSFLRNQRLGVQVQPIAKAKVPIIKFVEPISNIHIDVSFERTNGLTAAAQICKWLETTPGLRELVLVVKQFLASRKMNEVHVGGLGGYSTICLVYSFLKLHPRLSTGNVDPLQNLGCLLIEFFELYGNNYGYDNLVLAVDDRHGPRYLNRRNHPDLAAGRNPFSLVIQDPSDPSNNISRGSFNLRDLKKAFSGAYELLCSRCYELRSATYKERLGQSILGNVIKYRGVQRDFNDDRGLVVNEALDLAVVEETSIVTGKSFKRKRNQEEEIYFSDMTIESDEGR